MAINYDGYKAIKVEKQESIITITLNQPEKGNPTRENFPELIDVFERIPSDNEARVVILTAAGPDFSIGLDVRTIQPSEEKHPLQHCELTGVLIHRKPEQKKGHMMLLKRLFDVPQPIIAAVHGRCFGAAATLALNCDIIIAGDDLQIADTHITKGLVPGDGGAVIWPLLIGPARAKEYLMTGNVLSATEAEHIGLVNRLVPAGELQKVSWTMAKRLASSPPLAIRFTKHAINRMVAHQMELVWELADAYEVLSTLTEDHDEARRAIIENRIPHFTGR